jgi:hypothetical protein
MGRAESPQSIAAAEITTLKAELYAARMQSVGERFAPRPWHHSVRVLPSSVQRPVSSGGNPPGPCIASPSH